EAHSLSAIITGNFYPFFGEEPPATVEEIQPYLESILNHLNAITYDEENEERIRLAIDLTSSALEIKAEPGDPLYEEIHAVLHELDEYYNQNPYLDDVTAK